MIGYLFLIVENAVLHGAMSRKNGRVEIKVREDGDKVKILVRDNGHGISKEILEDLYRNTSEDDGIGLGNVHKRLCYIYGKENGLDIQSTPLGTTVNINIDKNRFVSLAG